MQGTTVVDEWDAWGDEAEIARRKAERQRAGLSPGQRRQLVSMCIRSILVVIFALLPLWCLPLQAARDAVLPAIKCCAALWRRCMLAHQSA